jgi:undecaprenyl-phosphate 4-deoxy-4-formamido-L-arabinose transferase
VTSPALLTEGISAVVPVYNGQSSLPELVDRLESVLPATSPGYEVILVDDGSADSSWEVIGQLAAKHPALRAIRLRRNYGQENAVLAGVRAARYATTVTLDDDLQDRPEEIPSLVSALTPRVDAVYGMPMSVPQSATRRVLTRVGKAFVRRSTGERSVAGSGSSTFRAFRTSLRDASAAYVGPFASVDVFLTWGTSRFASVPVQRDQRRYGRSNYSKRMLLSFAWDLMTGFSSRPIQIISGIGFLLAFGGLGVFVWAVIAAVVHGGTPGLSLLTTVLLILSSIQLIAIGVSAQYLARMHFQLMNKPTYLISEHLGDDQR